MIQTLPGAALNIRFAPMQTSEAIAPMASDANGLGQGGLNLVLYPGEPSELLLLFENTSADQVSLEVRLEGTCPSNWYHIQLAAHEIQPHQHMEGVLRFQAPNSFFEDHDALRPQQTLTLDYRLDVVVAYQQLGHPNGEQQVKPQATQQRRLEYMGLNLFVRPRTRLMELLPALYREVDFMHRYLHIFEQALRPILETVDALPCYLDPLTAPEALLPFLAHWVAWPVDDFPWTADQQRRLIRNAMEIYRWRGTRRGLRLFLHYVTGLPMDEHRAEADRSISIQESSSKAFTLGTAHLGPDTMLGRGRPYHFLVTLRPNHMGDIHTPLIHRIIAQEKPAHCTYDLRITPRPNPTSAALSTTP